MQITYATRFQCDACGVQADMTPPDNPWTSGSRPVPQGWASEFRLESFAVAHKMVTDLCTACMLRPFGEVLALLRKEERRG